MPSNIRNKNKVQAFKDKLREANVESGKDKITLLRQERNEIQECLIYVFTK